jgi:hypothetical protein
MNISPFGDILKNIKKSGHEIWHIVGNPQKIYYT